MGGHSSPGEWSDLGHRKEPRTGDVAPWSTKERVRAPYTSSDGVERFATVTVALGCFPLKQLK